MKRITVLSLLLVALLLTSVSVLAQDTFMGKTAEELFPGAANDMERDAAMAALLAANLPDSRYSSRTLDPPDPAAETSRPEES